MDDTDSAEIARFTRAFDEHYSSVFGYAASRVGRQLAEEVASETYLVAWRRIADLPEPAIGYLIGIARNVIRAQYRQVVSDETAHVEPHTWADGPITADIADSVVERSAVLHALAQLSESDREVLTLVAWHGLSTAQAAEVLGCNRASYFVRLHRARRRLDRAMHGPPPALHTRREAARPAASPSTGHAASPAAAQMASATPEPSAARPLTRPTIPERTAR